MQAIKKNQFVDGEAQGKEECFKKRNSAATIKQNKYISSNIT